MLLEKLPNSLSEVKKKKKKPGNKLFAAKKMLVLSQNSNKMNFFYD